MTKTNQINLILILLIINKFYYTKCDKLIDLHLPLASENKLVYHDCDRHDIFKNIPFHHVVPLITKYINTHPKKRNINTIINSPHFTSIVGGVVKSIQNQHLFGFVAAVGEHFADIVDHYVDVKKSVIEPNYEQDNETLFDQLNGKKLNKREISVPLENVGGLIRTVVRYLPAEESKHCYVKKYEPVVKKMKEQVSSKEFKKFIGRVHKSNEKLIPTTTPQPKKIEEPKITKKDKYLEKNKLLKKSLDKFKFNKPFDFLKNVKKE